MIKLEYTKPRYIKIKINRIEKNILQSIYIDIRNEHYINKQTLKKIVNKTHKYSSNKIKLYYTDAYKKEYIETYKDAQRIIDILNKTPPPKFIKIEEYEIYYIIVSLQILLGKLKHSYEVFTTLEKPYWPDKKHADDIEYIIYEKIYYIKALIKKITYANKQLK